jgi:hypothetical protein
MATMLVTLSITVKQGTALMRSEIPPAILSAIFEGRAILFLGAAASYDALKGGQPTRITAEYVKGKLSDQFLAGRYKDRPLQTVADFARNEDCLASVQSAIHSMFQPLVPNTFHMLIPQFRWKAIVTTNYDLVVERAYEKSPCALQELCPITRDGDDLENALKGQNTVPYLKLHGCINHHTDTQVPIVLDSQEYSKFSGGRQHLVATFKEWAVNHPILFCGYSLSDENVKQILFDIGDQSQARPQYLYVVPGLEQIESRYWATKRMAPYSETFQHFLEEIDSIVPLEKRKLASLILPSSLSISKWIPSHDRPSDALAQYLAEELVHITPEAPPSVQPIPGNFFSGLDISFDPIYANLDVRRQATDDLLNRVVIDTIKSTLPKFFVLRGYAGCGKSVITRRLAIETAALIDTPLVVYLPSGAQIRKELLLELQRLVEGRLYLFLDDLIEHNDSLPSLLQELSKKGIPVTVFATARTNEFNIYGNIYAGKISGDFELGDLEGNEVELLLERLSEHRLLGPLEEYDEADRRVFLEKFYGRQLLVALHEITKGDSLSAIIVDEFEKITPRASQQMYLDICTLHQCRVGVRSGFLSRLSGLRVEDLKTHLGGSLAKVVLASFDHRIRDYVYRSRHEEISRMVFDLAIPSADQRADQLKRILASMDLDYSSDRKAFFDLLKGRRLAEMFENKALATAVFEAAERSNPPMSYVHHQRAILELNHKNGNLEVAHDFLRRAEIEVREEGFSDASIKHTKANLLRKRALAANNVVERERYRADARAILKPQLFHRHSSHSETLYGQLLLDEIKGIFSQENSARTATAVATDATVRMVNELGALIDESLRLHPNEEQMILLKADFLKVIGKSPSALQLLENYCKKNEAAFAVTRVLAETLVRSDRVADAEKLLRNAVVIAPSDKAINLAFAKVLIELDESAHHETILMHLRRSFSDGDSNYDARFFYARSSMLYGDVDRGRSEFDSLRKPYIRARDRVRNIVKAPNGAIVRFSGKLLSKQAGYGFVMSPELRFHSFLSKANMSAEVWDQLYKGAAIKFSLGFNFLGPIAIDVEGPQLSLIGSVSTSAALSP